MADGALARPGDAIGRALGPNRDVYKTRCRQCSCEEFNHEDDGACDLCDCDGFTKE